LEVRGQLEEQHAELRSERGGGPAERPGEVLAALQSRIVRDAPWRLEREGEAVRRAVRPAFEQCLGWHPVEGVVDLDRGEALGIVGEHLARGELLGIERAAPFGVVVAGGADQTAHMSMPNAGCQMLPHWRSRCGWSSG